MHLAIFLFEMITFIYVLRVSKPLPAPHGILAYCIFANVILFLEENNLVDRLIRAGAFFGEIQQNSETTLLFFYLFVLALLATTKKTTGQPGGFRIEAASKLLKRYQSAPLALSFLFYAVAIIHFFCLNHDALYFNTQYQLIESPNGLTINNSFSSAIHLGFPLLSIFVWGFFSTGTSLRSWKVAGAYAPLAAWSLIYQLAQNSRYTIVYMSVFLIVNFIAAPDKKRMRVLFLVPLIYIVYLHCLLGRTKGSNGIAGIYDNLLTIEDLLSPGNFWKIARNLFQGVYVVADGLVYRLDYDPLYKIMSFSPFPSIIDGFAAVRDQYMVNVFNWVPMPAPVEILSFGPVYVIFASGILLLAIRANLKLINSQNSVLDIVINTVIAFSFVYSLAYPVRTMFRLIEFSLFISMIRLIQLRPGLSASRGPIRRLGKL